VSLFLSNCELHHGKCYFSSVGKRSQSNPFDTVSESRTVRTPPLPYHPRHVHTRGP